MLQSKDLGWEPDERVEEILLETEWYAFMVSELGCGAKCVFYRSSGDVDKVKDVARGLVDALASGMNAL